MSLQLWVVNTISSLEQEAKRTRVAIPLDKIESIVGYKRDTNTPDHTTIVLASGRYIIPRPFDEVLAELSALVNPPER